MDDARLPAQSALRMAVSEEAVSALQLPLFALRLSTMAMAGAINCRRNHGYLSNILWNDNHAIKGVRSSCHCEL